jgi:hypothetical protein
MTQAFALPTIEAPASSLPVSCASMSQTSFIETKCHVAAVGLQTESFHRGQQLQNQLISASKCSKCQQVKSLDQFFRSAVLHVSSKI